MEVANEIFDEKIFRCWYLNNKRMIVNRPLEDYLVQHSSQEDPLLKELSRETHLKAINPRMLSGHLQGKLLEYISRMIQPLRILEIGTYTGYSTICLARGLKMADTFIPSNATMKLSAYQKVL